MPGWGTGSFENEDAQNFLKRLSSLAIEDLTEILSRTADEKDYVEASDSGIAVVVAEIVATAKGIPSSIVPTEISDWLRKIEGTPSSGVSDLARRAVHKVRTSSELKDLWLEAGGLNEWSAGLRDLEHRLAR